MKWFDEDLRPSQIMTEDAFHNAICVLNAIGGSTNAVIHLIAIAGRLGIPLPLNLFDEISQVTPMIVNLKPSGRFLMEHLHRAGGLPAVMREVGELLRQDCLTVSGKVQREHIKDAQCFDRDVVGFFRQANISIRGIGRPEGKSCPFRGNSKGVFRN